MTNCRPSRRAKARGKLALGDYAEFAAIGGKIAVEGFISSQRYPLRYFGRRGRCAFDWRRLPLTGDALPALWRWQVKAV